MKQAKAAKANAEKHISFREKSIKAREDKKRAQRRASGGAFDLLKKFFLALILALFVIAVLAILGCEMEVDGLKESFVCTIGKPPPEDRRRLNIEKRIQGRSRRYDVIEISSENVRFLRGSVNEDNK